MTPSAERPSKQGPQSTRPHAIAARDHGLDIALVILRAAALLVVGTWGWAKFHGLINIVHSGRPLANSGFVRLVRQLGFPLPRFMAVCAIINESVVACLLFLGIVTRPAALVASLGMAGAWYSSIVLGEEPLRAALCTTIFATLAFCGAGQYSADYLLWPRKAISSTRGKDVGLLLLRAGIAMASLALAIVSTATDRNLLAFAPDAHWPLVLACSGGVIVAFGVFTRPVSAVFSVFWSCAMVSALYAGVDWNMSPIRAALFATAFLGLTFSGPGRISIAAIYDRGRMQATATEPELS
jgi:uncharacterized membrane protein YphA (DoxX/SURF4 family)